MAYYDALIAKWATLNPGTTQNKLDQVNAATASKSGSTNVPPSKIVNAFDPTELGTLTQLQISTLSLLLSGSTVDASAGSAIRAGLQRIFNGKTTTLSNLTALAAQYDSQTVPWWQANGYPRAFDLGDIAAAGLS